MFAFLPKPLDPDQVFVTAARALERARLVGDRPPPVPAGYPAPVAWIGVRPERAAHDRAIEARARAQLTGGLLDETAALRARYPDGMRSFSAMGYREAMTVLDGHRTLDEAIADDAARTKAYARRQATWFRAEPGQHRVIAHARPRHRRRGRPVDDPARFEVGALRGGHGGLGGVALRLPPFLQLVNACTTYLLLAL